MTPLIVWVLVVHSMLSGTDDPTAIYQTQGGCVGVGIYNFEHTPRVSRKGDQETASCVRKGLIDVD
jgi:hypothetical protein